MKLYNTAEKKISTTHFSDQVRMYLCGITPYDSAHMGHAFTFTMYDVLQRYLEYKNHTVTIVRNVTDVDEPIYKKAAELGIPYIVLAERETKKFQAVMQQLHISQPFAEPRASEYIHQIADAVKKLLDNGAAYRLENHDIYFDIKAFAQFGELSHFSPKLQHDFMRDRGGDPERPGKRNTLDFLLWKSVTDSDDPAQWHTVVGNGRPGWHIECSVMSSSLLGPTIDIHGGGMDLIFPHHEAEHAQNETLGTASLVQHWMHVAPLLYHGEKMSKSLGNLVFAETLFTEYEPAAIRLALLKYHYRIGGEWVDDLVKDTTNDISEIRRALHSKHSIDASRHLEVFCEAIENDLDTPEAARIMGQLVTGIIDSTEPESELESKKVLQTMLDVLGIVV